MEVILGLHKDDINIGVIWRLNRDYIGRYIGSATPFYNPWCLAGNLEEWIAESRRL